MNGAVKKGDNVLITGIGGGVALIALQICVAQGANVYVTSGSTDKIQKAVELGAKGGVSYKDSASEQRSYSYCTAHSVNYVFPGDWPKQLGELMYKNRAEFLSVVIDAGGGDIMGKTSPLLKQGGRVVVYGMYVPHPLVHRFVCPPLVQAHSTESDHDDARSHEEPAVNRVHHGISPGPPRRDQVPRGAQDSTHSLACPRWARVC